TPGPEGGAAFSPRSLRARALLRGRVLDPAPGQSLQPATSLLSAGAALVAAVHRYPVGARRRRAPCGLLGARPRNDTPAPGAPFGNAPTAVLAGSTLQC